MKQKLLILLAVIMTALNVHAVDFEADGLFYNIISTSEVEVTYDGVSYSSGWECPSQVTIPEEVTYKGKTYSVTTIGDHAFSYCNALTSVVIGNSVTSIGAGAFSSCSSLTSVEIPNSVTSIGYGAFQDCSSLTSVEIPNSVTSIGDYAFSSCSSLTSVLIGNSVTSIGANAFRGCSSLTTVEIPNSVTSIGAYAFSWCSSLTSVEIPNLLTKIREGTFFNCSSLASVVIPNSVTSIGYDAFVNCSSLTSVVIPNSVTSIGAYAFSGCSSLTSVEIPNSVTSIGDRAFNGCSLDEVRVSWISPAKIEIGKDAFYHVYKTNLYVPTGTIGKYQNLKPWSSFNEIFEYGPDVSGGDEPCDGLGQVWTNLVKLEDLGLGSEATDLPGQTILAENDGIEFMNAFDDQAKIVSISADGVESVVIDGIEYILTSGTTGSTNPQGVTIETPPTGGWVYQINIDKDGYLTLFSKFSSNKAYYVWEGDADTGLLETYDFAMYVDLGDGAKVYSYTLPGDEYGYFNMEVADAEKYSDGVNLRWPEKIFLGADAEDVKNNGFGCITFPVYAEVGTYLFHAQGSKANTNGVIYTENKPKSIVANAPEKTADDGTVTPALTINLVGDGAGINDIISDVKADENAPIFNVLGQQVNKNAKGILIQNGKKFYNR